MNTASETDREHTTEVDYESPDRKAALLVAKVKERINMDSQCRLR